MQIFTLCGPTCQLADATNHQIQKFVHRKIHDVWFHTSKIRAYVLTWNWRTAACCWRLCFRLLVGLLLTDRCHACWGRGTSKLASVVIVCSAWVWSLRVAVLCSERREKERCGVQGKVVKEWRWLWWLYGWMNGGSCGHELVITGAHPLPSSQVSLLGVQYGGRRVNNTCSDQLWIYLVPSLLLSQIKSIPKSVLAPWPCSSVAWILSDEPIQY
jgi:hypothetical protein